MSGLPNATRQNPACGACGDETTCDGDGFTCRDCEIIFDPEELNASFIDPDNIACGAECENWWHGDHRIVVGQGYECGTCQLPAGHQTKMHWTGCRTVKVGVQ